MSKNELVQRVAAKAVIMAEDGILALHPSEIDENRKWHIPGGIRDDILEPIEQTGIREVAEETGIDLNGHFGKIVKVGEWSAVDKGERVRILAVFFLYSLDERPNIRISPEHVEYAWLDKANHQKFTANPEVHELIEELL